MKYVVIGRKHDPLKFTMQAVGLEYFDKEKGEFVMIEANKLDISENQITARFADYELGFQNILTTLYVPKHFDHFVYTQLFLKIAHLCSSKLRSNSKGTQKMTSF